MHPAASFRPVPRTGVIYVMTEAAKRDFPMATRIGPILDRAPQKLKPYRDAFLVWRESHWKPRSMSTRLWKAVSSCGKPWPICTTLATVEVCRASTALKTSPSLTRWPVGPHPGRSSAGQRPPWPPAPRLHRLRGALRHFSRFCAIPIVLDEQNGFHLSPEALRKAVVERGSRSVSLLFEPLQSYRSTDPRGGNARVGGHLARELSCTLILDEFYSHYSYTPTPLKAVACPKCRGLCGRRRPRSVLLVDGMSKNWRYPGWRLSWTVGPRSIIEKNWIRGFLLGWRCIASHSTGLSRPHLRGTSRPRGPCDSSHLRCQTLTGHREAPSHGDGLAVAPEGAFYTFPLPGPTARGASRWHGLLPSSA